MSDLVRARLDSGVETSIARFFAVHLNAEVLDEPTHEADGSLRRDTLPSGNPVKPRVKVPSASVEATPKTPASNKAAGTEAAEPASSEKE